MKLFGKKKRDGDSEDKDSLAKKPVRRRRKKKEPPKPWGKKERLILLSIILFTSGASVVLALSARAWKLPGIPRPKLPSISIPFFGEEKIVIETRGGRSYQGKQSNWPI